MALVEQDKVRPIPKVKLTDDDEALIKMAQAGAFLVTYNATRKGIDALGDLDEILQDAKGEARTAVNDIVQKNIETVIDVYVPWSKSNKRKRRRARELVQRVI